jgi:hypothetical protein
MQMAVLCLNRKASSYPLQGVGTFWLCDVDLLPTGNGKNTSNSRSFKAHGHTLFNDERYGGHLILYKQFIDNCFKILQDRPCMPRRLDLFILQRVR